MNSGDTSHTQSPETCGMVGCNGVPMTVFPCDCEFVICAECFRRAAGPKCNGPCPACQQPYDLAHMRPRRMGNKVVSWEDLQDHENRGQMSNRSNYDSERNADISGWQRENGEAHDEYDHDGRHDGRAEDADVYDSDDDDDDDGEGRRKKRRPLSRQMSVPIVILSIYRLVIVIRFFSLALYLIWRVSNVNNDAVWLWGISVVCEIWFAFSWVLDQLPKLSPINRTTDLAVLKEKFDKKGPENPSGRSDLPGIDVFITTADPEKEPSLVTANTVLSILASDYPVEKLACYVSDDGGALLTYEAMAEAASFAHLWVPFCRKHGIEPRSPEAYFNSKRDPYNNKVRPDFVKDRRRLKHEYDKYKVRINALPDLIRQRSDANNAREELEAIERQRQEGKEDDEIPRFVNNQKATWMDNDCHWAGTWLTPKPNHMKGDHAGIIQVLLVPQGSDPQYGTTEGANGVPIDFTGVDTRLPMLVYMSREKRPGFDHNKKAGAMNALVRASAVMSNGAFILNLDCDHYVYNSHAFREAICFMMSNDGDRVAFIQFPQRFEGIDPSDRYSNRNTVFFDINMRALDGLQGPVYVGTGCMFRRIALYGFDPPRFKIRNCYNSLFGRSRNRRSHDHDDDDQPLRESGLPGRSHWSRKFGSSEYFLSSIDRAEFEGRPLADHISGRNRRERGTLRGDRLPINNNNIEEAIDVISCPYEEKTGWGNNVGWVYGSITEDVVTGYKMHTRGWRSVYCITKRDAFRGTAPINLTDRLIQVLRWATGSIEIFFSRNNVIFAGPRLMFLQRIAYLNVAIYPFTSIFLIVFCFIPALSLFSGQFIVQQLNVAFLAYLLAITATLCILAVLEIKWSGISLDEWWRNEQFWMIGGTSAHLFAVFQGLLKVIGGIETSFTLTAKSSGEDEEDEFAELYVVKWTSLMIPPITIMMVNIIAIAVGFTRTIYSNKPNWGKLLGGVFFSFWVLAHLYPFAKGVMGRRGKTPAIVFVWSGLVAITIALLFDAIYPPSPDTDLSGSFSFP
ncbi:hypothetical protein LUZ61_017588 [Rhynchospora tenuis]|uniref:Uncharacterized protein n=1 Tax=Rhynchospora tenuis TaxID=198213 RepID=A0AAD5Z7U1_9POAL|nr:hypothetical protein LUZ61_017588 [Rhynchospora tenuis]